MTATPSEYDVIQDGRLEGLEGIVVPSYEPPEGTEYSYPVEGQGISQDQFQTFSLAQANGMIHGETAATGTAGGGDRYYLEGHNSDAETNSKNSMMLRVSRSTGTAESLVEGFYHRLNQDMEISLPAVTKTTTYHVALTYDPRNFSNPEGPVRIRVYTSKPPTSFNRVHVLLHTVRRAPNQLLSETIVTRYRQFIAGTIGVQDVNQLPDPATVPSGTIGVPTHAGGGVYCTTNAGASTREWVDLVSHLSLKPGPWKSITIFSAYGWSGDAFYRTNSGGIDVMANLQNEDYANSGSSALQFPTGMTFKRAFDDTAVTASGTTVIFSNEGERSIRSRSTSRYLRINSFIPDYFINAV